MYIAFSTELHLHGPSLYFTYKRIVTCIHYLWPHVIVLAGEHIWQKVVGDFPILLQSLAIKFLDESIILGTNSM